MIDEYVSEGPLLLRVIDVRQWTYCARVPYFAYVMPIEARASVKMDHGAERHQIVQAFERRRILRRYGLERAEKIFNLHLTSRKRGLTGIIDMVLRDGSICYPVEFKHSRREPFINHKLQLVAYAVLLEDVLEVSVPSGFIHNTWSKRTFKVEITAELRKILDEILVAMREMIRTERMPDPAAERAKCADCEFRRWCGDV
jgi:CRISPR-associated exonuclease Cas4